MRPIFLARCVSIWLNLYNMTRLGPIEHRVTKRLQELQENRILERLRAKDLSLWPEKSSAQIQKRLGWISSFSLIEKEIPRITKFVEEIKNDGFTHALLLGMGGSSLCPLLWTRTFLPRPGFLTLDVLDSTEPRDVLAATERSKEKKVLYIVSSKSGGTIEVTSLDRYFYDRTPDRSLFAAITDAGSPLAQVAQKERFRTSFLNPEDIGGRYSALSFFGLVPAALMGIDISYLLASAKEFAASEDPGISLGAILAESILSGRDKLTLFFSPDLSSLGGWIEQLVAESLGKDGQGMIPVDQEPFSEVPRANDRIFVMTRSRSSAREATLFSLSDMGHPYIEFTLNQTLDLGKEFYRWEVATAVAGSILGIDPFDEPNVSESKENTKRLLHMHDTKSLLPKEKVIFSVRGISLYADPAMPVAKSLSSTLQNHFSRGKDGDYVAILSYLSYGAQEDRLKELGATLSAKTGLAITLNYGPRYLHSTGQLHKGGANRGLFLMITEQEKENVPIPGVSYSFGILQRAQAQGDFDSLVKHGRRILWADIKNTPQALDSLIQTLQTLVIS